MAREKPSRYMLADDRKRLRKIHHQTRTGARAAAIEAQSDTIAAASARRSLFKEDGITVALFVFVFCCTILPLSMLILLG
ncbi:MAG: hypothetical protein AAGE80_15880 [Pseudomonadota bacterium]